MVERRKVERLKVGKLQVFSHGKNIKNGYFSVIICSFRERYCRYAVVRMVLTEKGYGLTTKAPDRGRE